MGIQQLNKHTGIKALGALGESLDRVLDSAVQEITNEMVADAVHTVHVITGNLQSSIDNEKVENAHWQVKATAPYAGYEEKGNRYREGHPYLEPAVLAHIDDLEKLVNGKAEEVTEHSD